VLPSTVTDYRFTNLGATTDGLEAATCFNWNTQVGSDVWFSWIAPGGGDVKVSLCGSDYDTRLAIYDDQPCPPVSDPVSCNDDACWGQSELTFTAVAGKKYLIRIGGWFGLQGTGVLNIDHTTDVKDVESDILPETYALFQNYPNPFNSGTEIRFGIPATQRATLSVYDVLGREVRRLVDEELSGGAKSIRWDGRNASGQPLPSGIYFYRLTTDHFAESKRMVLLK
jgi:hypothetical protein